MQKLLSKLWAPCLLLFLTIILFANNFSPDTYFSGWDNLHPEFYPLMNLERAWHTAWQEYQGLGLLAGMAHGADFFRQLTLLPLTLLLPAELFRYAWHFLMATVGVLGSFYLFKFLLRQQNNQNLLSFLGASFYLLNFATVQNFYVTFEPFAAFYAFLPVLLLFLLKLLSQKTLFKKNLLIFFLISIVASSMDYVQTIFVVYFSLVCLLFLFHFLQKRHDFKKVFTLFALILEINAFWLLNVLHFTVGNSELLAASKGKAMSNDVLILKNQAFGDYAHLAKMQGFWLGETDFDQFGNAVYLFDVWKTHFSNPLVVGLAFGFFALLLFGLWQIFRKKVANRYFILSAFLLSVWMMALELFPFSLLTRVFEQLPLFSEMFRINFTKWVVPFSLFYSLLLTFGLAFLFSLLKKRLLQIIFSLVFFTSLIFYSWPSFQGHFFYERLRVQIPEAYFDLFAYFKNEAPASSRIANLPQHSFYGWQWNNWGYRGSGFLWYGIKQPILDRAFDVWSAPLEGYYWELQAALDHKDVSMLEAVFSKYDVDYVLLDTSIVNHNTAKPFNYDALKDLLAASDKLQLREQFDFISLYTFDDQENERESEFVTLYDSAPVLGSAYQHAWQDQAFADLGDYVRVFDNQASDAVITYPFASQFTNHSQRSLPFSIEEDEDFFYLNSTQALAQSDLVALLPDLVQVENELPFAFSWQREATTLRATFEFLSPIVYFGEQKYEFKLQREIVLDARFCQESSDCQFNVNGQLFDLTDTASKQVLLQTKLPNVISLSHSNKTDYFDYELFDLRAVDLPVRQVNHPHTDGLLLQIPKVIVQVDLLSTELNRAVTDSCRPLNQGSVLKEIRPEGNFYQAVGTSICEHFYLADLKHQASYLFRLDASNLRSLPFTFAVQVESLGRSPLETYLDDGVNYQIFPPVEQFHQGYTLYLSTNSYGREVNQNLLSSAVVFAWPYQFVKQLSLRSVVAPSAATISGCDWQVDKKALWLYQLEVSPDCSATYLKLSQAHDLGWLALSDGRLLPHSKWNNWANVWQLPADGEVRSIYIFFWPQLLQYVGFGLLLMVGMLVIFKRR